MTDTELAEFIKTYPVFDGWTILDTMACVLTDHNHTSPTLNLAGAARRIEAMAREINQKKAQ